MDFHHIPVLPEEVIENLNLKPGQVVVDCTVGGAGHSLEIIRRITPGGTLVAIDRDEEALAAAKAKLAKYLENIIFINDNFKNISKILENTGIKFIEGVLIDLGVSSHQLDKPYRGFSYMHDAPLDMRMDRKQRFTAEQLVNEFSEDELARLIWEYGEERWAKRIAQKIVSARKKETIKTTAQLVEIIKSAIPSGARKNGPHPAKRTFQALRIAVNEELTDLDKAIKDAVHCLAQGGRIAIISFHSLEDRIIKNTFKLLAAKCVCPPELPVCQCNHKKELKIISRKPITASNEELQKNPRARSAKLRIAEKV
ncbi:MAG: rRNA (cytosine1402-N4)-methyltransferase [Clostridia bacterium]|nr:rRNA (cytosine1402-N4)-methyltransferase [Clostridia bacterium]